MISRDRSGPDRIERLGPGEDTKASRPAHSSTILFGADATRRFLDEPGHHLLIAYDDDTPAGFVTGWN